MFTLYKLGGIHGRNIHNDGFNNFNNNHLCFKLHIQYAEAARKYIGWRGSLFLAVWRKMLLQ